MSSKSSISTDGIPMGVAEQPLSCAFGTCSRRFARRFWSFIWESTSWPVSLAGRSELRNPNPAYLLNPLFYPWLIVDI